MLVGIDHLVVAVADPESAGVELAESLGIAVTGGGRHPASGTRNRLAFLGDSYLELIGVWDRRLAAADPIGRAVLATLEGPGAGLATFALATDDIDGDVARLRAAGSSIVQPRAGERRQPDGNVVRWRVAFPAEVGRAAPPFLIEHELSGAEWGREARRRRNEFEHPVGGRLRLVGLELAVPDPAVVADAYRRDLGLAAEPAAGQGPGEREVRVGSQAIRLVHEDPPGLDGPRMPAPPVRVGLRGSTGERAVVDRFGVRFARL